MAGWEIPTDWDDPFMDEQYAQDFADVVALPGADTYHTDQARNLRWLHVRNDAMRLHSLAGDIADTVTDLDLEPGAAEELADRLQKALLTIGVALTTLRNPKGNTHE